MYHLMICYNERNRKEDGPLPFDLFVHTHTLEMNATLEEDTIAHDNNTPKLQWLALLIPALGAFVAYSLIRRHNKRRKAQQMLLNQESQQLPLHQPITVPSPAHPPSLFWQRLYPVEQSHRERRRQRRSRRLQRQQHDAPPPAYSPSFSTLPKYEDITEPTQTH